MITPRDLYFMKLAEITATRSKDPNTKVGACIANDKKVLSLGWNGAPRQIDDNLVPYECRDRSKPLKDQKYPYIVHAEINAILNYGGKISDLDGASVYVNVFPCCDCTKALIQAGIKEVFYLEDYSDSDMSKYLFDLAGVKYNKMEVDNGSTSK